MCSGSRVNGLRDRPGIGRDGLSSLCAGRRRPLRAVGLNTIKKNFDRAIGKGKMTREQAAKVLQNAWPEMMRVDYTNDP